MSNKKRSFRLIYGGGLLLLLIGIAIFLWVNALLGLINIGAALLFILDGLLEKDNVSNGNMIIE